MGTKDSTFEKLVETVPNLIGKIKGAKEKKVEKEVEESAEE